MIVDIESAATFGTGHILHTDGRYALVALKETEVAARMAVAPYRPAPGDEVLVVCNGEDSFVIGVLRIAGTAELTAPGDLKVWSAGLLDLTGAREARLSGPRISVEALTLRVVARSVTERFESARRWVRECFQVKAGRLRTDVDGACETQAGRIVQCADGSVRIDGESIDLG
jgi:hypothetical protein